MRVDAFHYELPPERIAQRPEEDREASRLMSMRGEAIEDRFIRDLPDLLDPGSLVIVNDTRVIPARLIGKKNETGGRVEIFLVRRVETRFLEIVPGDERTARTVEIWRALGKASKQLKFGSDVTVSALPSAKPLLGRPDVDRLVIRLLGRAEDDGLLEVALFSPSDEPIDEAIRACGHVPLPPYIKRDDDAADEARYQTVFARRDGAIAAPTAGLHLTQALIGRLAVRGCELASVTLHVGLGTFQPVTVDDLDAHPMHSERLHVSRTAATAIARARERGSKVVAIGTTVVRALESAADPSREGFVLPTPDGGVETRLLIQPGYRFRVVDTLLTNFHLPKSTLVALVCAFGGQARVLAAYREAVEKQYRFFSYGDAMLLDRAPASSGGGEPAP